MACLLKHPLMARYRVFVFVIFFFLSSVIKFDRKCGIQHKDDNRRTLEVDD